ncbi:CDC45 family [Calycina marina]|uniref:CDC45 family n=1 Tax=Calycina marina TaxID=1763456 RepID=A0A9P7ZBW6_9HELO|nr:CDC45 family [Calycina marina]
MYLPRSLLAKLYTNIKQANNATTAPILILASLEPDAVCASQMLAQLLKGDYISHKIVPVPGYGVLEKIGREEIRPMMTSEGISGGTVICLGVGGLVDLGALLGIDNESDQGSFRGVEVWVIDSRRPWNLSNVFGGIPSIPQLNGDGPVIQRHTGLDGAKILSTYKPGRGGIIVCDDGDIEEELDAERDAYMALIEMPEVEENDDSDGSDTESEDEESESKEKPQPGQKRKSSDRDEDDKSSDDENRPTQRRRSNSSSPVNSPSRAPKRGLMSISGPSDFAASDSRSASPSPAQPVKQPSARTLRLRLQKLRRKNEAVLQAYYSLGASYSEPISAMIYSLASDLGREDNDLLWLAIVGITSMDLYGRSGCGVAVNVQRSNSGWHGTRGSRIRQLLRDEVRRLNAPQLSDSDSVSNRSMLPENSGIIPTTARCATDTSIKLSPEPKFLLIRHWSLHDSMLHSPYLAARLRIWSEAGRKRLSKLLAKMGISIVQSKERYTQMDIELRRGLRSKLLKYSELYNLDNLVPSIDTDGKDRGGKKEGWGFVRSWGYRATLSADDVGVIVGAILEVGKHSVKTLETGVWDRREASEFTDEDGTLEGEDWVGRFWGAYDALKRIDVLLDALPVAQYLHRAILRTGTLLLEKNQLRHLRAFRMCVVKEGPDASLFTHPSALTKLALWLGEAIAEQEKEKKGRLGHGGRGTPLVVAGLNETRGVYVVVGTGGGGGALQDRDALKARQEKRNAKTKAKELRKKNKDKVRDEKRAARRRMAEENGDEEEEETESEGSESEEDSDDEADEPKAKGFGRNKFGNAFQEVVEETQARVRIDSFEHCVVEVKKEDLSGFMESLSMKAVVG